MLDNFRLMSFEELLKEIDEAPTWDAIDNEVYEWLCDQLDLDYHSYEYPEELFEAMKKAVKEKQKNEE